MTRLREEDVCNIAAMLADYDRALALIAGPLCKIGACASGRMQVSDTHKKAAVVPVTSGQGVIPGFAQTVCAILRHLGADAFVTQSADVAGLSEAVAAGTELLFTADDETFAALNLKTGQTADNGEYTGRGYAAGLSLLCGGVDGKKALVLGAGPVGTGAAHWLASHGAQVHVFDKDCDKAKALAVSLPGAVAEADFVQAFRQGTRLIVEATPQPALIEEAFLRGDEFVAAPGIPFGLSEGAAHKLSGRVLHDALEIGVAAMFFAVL